VNSGGGLSTTAQTVTGSFTFNALSQSLIVPLSGQSLCSVGAPAATVNWQVAISGSIDGTNYFGLSGSTSGPTFTQGGPSPQNGTFNVVNTGFYFQIPVGGLVDLKIVSNAYTSGSQTVTVSCGQGTAFGTVIYGNTGSNAAVQVPQGGSTYTPGNGLNTQSQTALYNGTNYENAKTAAGITGGSAPAGLAAFAPCNGASATANCASVLYNALLTMTGGTTTATVAAASAGPNVIKASAGRLARVVISTAGTTGTDIFYDNASACSGTIIAEIAGTTALSINVAGGVPFVFDMPAANGITECGGTGSAAVTVSYY
jgi:hypothetical protein